MQEALHCNIPSGYCALIFVVILKENDNYVPVQHKLVGLCKQWQCVFKVGNKSN